MKKPASLQKWLLDSVDHLKTNPESLHIHIDGGNLNCRLENSLHFCTEYTLTLFVMDMEGTSDLVMVPLLAWVQRNQIDIKPDAIKFSADILNRTTYDLEITLPLSENCVINIDDDGKWSTIYQDEHQPDYLQPEPAKLQTLFGNNEQLGP